MPIINNNSDENIPCIRIIRNIRYIWLGNTKLLHLINIIWHVYHINCILSSSPYICIQILCTVTHRKTITSSFFIHLQTGNLLGSCYSCYYKGLYAYVGLYSMYNLILFSVDGLPHTTITRCSGAYLTPVH